MRIGKARLPGAPTRVGGVVGQVFRWPVLKILQQSRGDTSWDKRQGGGAALRLRLAVGQRSLDAGFWCARRVRNVLFQAVLGGTP